MKIWTIFTCTVLFSWELASGQGYKPPSGYVPDSKTAVKIAEAVLVPVYGEKHIESERPFTATLKDGAWIVTGTLRCPDGREGTTTSCDGGVAEVQISKDDARILYMMHGK
ncbi:MAG: YbbC/YhhH family protein [Terriglobales bacterium]